jgi:hypothetical protein
MAQKEEDPMITRRRYPSILIVGALLAAPAAHATTGNSLHNVSAHAFHGCSPADAAGFSDNGYYVTNTDSVGRSFCADLGWSYIGTTGTYSETVTIVGHVSSGTVTCWLAAIDSSGTTYVGSDYYYLPGPFYGFAVTVSGLPKSLSVYLGVVCNLPASGSAQLYGALIN